MRLFLSINRHKLPRTQLVWSVHSSQPRTIAQLLEDVNLIIPLESESWGLEDYVVEVDGSECLHFQSVFDVLKDEDTVG